MHFIAFCFLATIKSRMYAKYSFKLRRKKSRENYLISNESYNVAIVLRSDLGITFEMFYVVTATRKTNEQNTT